MAIAKLNSFPGLTKIALETIEKNEMEQALRAAAFVCDAHLHDLKVEFLAREAKIRQQYLDAVSEIVSGE